MSLSPLDPPIPAAPRGGLLVPPYVDWPAFYAAKAGELHQGMHVLFSGPTQSGKTVLCRFLVALRDFVVVLGTKPRDASLDAYVAEGYLRIDHWPPTKRDLRKGEERWPPGQVRLLLWPQIRQRADLRRFRDVYLACLEYVFVDGYWTLVVDEGLWVAGREGLDLGEPVGDIAYGSASSGVSLYLLLQRPSGVPRIVWSSIAEAEIFHTGVSDDLRALASLGTYPPRDVQRVIQENLKGHQFLSLPTRGQAEWAISEVAT